MQDRAAGALLGLAWGDVLGAPVEGWSADDIRRHFGEYRDLPDLYPPSVAELPTGRRRSLRPIGLHTDDTQQALALLAVCIEGFTPEGWASWLVSGVVGDAWRDTGPNFRASVRALHAGDSPFASGSPSAGIGAAMRSGPLGAWFRDDPLGLQIVAFESATVTHADIRAATAAFAVAHAVRQLVAGNDALAILDRLVDDISVAETSWRARAEGLWAIAGTNERPFSAALEAVLADEPGDPADLAASVERHAEGQLSRHVVPLANHGFAVLGGIHALLSGLLWDQPPEDVLAELIRQGVDTDTVGAICGSILGARHGAAWIPTGRLLDHERLVAWSQAIATHGQAPETRAQFLARERTLTAIEHRHQG